MTSEHFSAAELGCHCPCGVNGCTQKLVDALETLRLLVGVPITVDCAYRCDKHNAAVGGVPNSEHTKGLAADIKIQGMTPRQMYQVAQRVSAFGGIGVAEHQGYVHVDVRQTYARWCYSRDGKQCAWNHINDVPTDMPELPAIATV